MAGWPWPLDAVQGWFESLWNHITSAAAAAVNVVNGWIWGAINWLQDRVRDFATWIAEHVLDPLVYATISAFNVIAQVAAEGLAITDQLVKDLPWPVNRILSFFMLPFALTYVFLKPVITWVWDMIRPGIEALKTGLGKVGETVYNALPKPLKDFIGWIGDLGASLWYSLNAFIKDPVGSLKKGWDLVSTGVSNAVNSIASYVSGAVGGAVTTLSTMFNGAVSALGSWVSDALAGVARALGEALSGFMSWITEKLQWLAQSIIGVAIAVKDAVFGFFEWVARGFISQITSIFGPGTPDTAIQNEAETAFKSMLDELEQLTKIERKSQIPYEALATAIVSTAARFLVLKIGVEAAGAAVDAAHPIKGLKAHEIAAGLMAVLDMPAVIGPILAEPINQGIFIPWRQYWASRYTPQIPGPGDLIRFVVREVIEVGVFRSNLALQGFSAFWADAFWEAHWELPSRGELVDAYHRGVIPEGELDKFMIWHDYKPEPRPGIGKSDLAILSGIRKTLIPRVDLRRGYAAGSLTWEQLVERYKWLGYEDDAELMASIQVAVAFTAERGKLRDNAKDDYVRGFILEDTLRADLAELGFGDVEIEYFVADAKADRLRKHKQELLASYEDGYQKELLTDADLAEREAEIIKDPDTLSLVLERAYIKKYKKPAPPKPETIKTATLAYLASAFRGDIISEAEFREELTRRLYTSEDIETIISVELLKKRKAAGE